MDTVATLFDEAQIWHRTGNLQAASTLYQKLLSLDPQHIPSLHALAVLYSQIGRMEEALSTLDSALKLQPESAELHNTLGNIFLKMGDSFAAEKSFKTAIHYKSDYAAAYNNLGNALYRQRQLEQGLFAYTTALKIEPTLNDAHYNLALIYSQQNKNEEALHSLKELLEKDPQHLRPTLQIAKIYYNQGDFSASIPVFKKALELQADNAEIHHDLGLSLLANKDYAAAITEFKKCLVLDKQHSEAHYHLATAYLQEEELQKALNHYLQQLSISPHLDAYYNIGVLLTTLNRNEEAIPYFEEVLRLDPDYQNAHLNLGVIHLKFGRQTAAINHYEQALKINPKDSEINYILAGLSQSEATPSTAPAQYLSHLFDQYALYYDKHLQEHLHYQVPEEIFNSLKNHTELLQAKWNILDLGCGTGLSGILLQPFAKQLVGVDISENMLDLASQKNIYTQLEQADISDFLDSAQDFNYMIAADVFSYHGKLESLFAKAQAALASNGYFSFSVERGFKYPYHLEQSLRYTHTKEYIQELIQKYHFNCISFDNLVLRRQQNDTVEGYLLLLQK